MEQSQCNDRQRGLDTTLSTHIIFSNELNQFDCRFDKDIHGDILEQRGPQGATVYWHYCTWLPNTSSTLSLILEFYLLILVQLLIRSWLTVHLIFLNSIPMETLHFGSNIFYLTTPTESLYKASSLLKIIWTHGCPEAMFYLLYKNEMQIYDSNFGLLKYANEMAMVGLMFKCSKEEFLH